MKGWKRDEYDHVIGQTGNIAVLALNDEYTPVIVTNVRNGETATFDCALCEGELHDGYALTAREQELLIRLEEKAEAWFNKVRPDGWEG